MELLFLGITITVIYRLSQSTSTYTHYTIQFNVNSNLRNYELFSWNYVTFNENTC